MVDIKWVIIAKNKPIMGTITKIVAFIILLQKVIKIINYSIIGKYFVVYAGYHVWILYEAETMY